MSKVKKKKRKVVDRLIIKALGTINQFVRVPFHVHHAFKLALEEVRRDARAHALQQAAEAVEQAGGDASPIRAIPVIAPSEAPPEGVVDECQNSR